MKVWILKSHDFIQNQNLDKSKIYLGNTFSKEYKKAFKYKQLVMSWTRKKFDNVENFRKWFLDLEKYFANKKFAKIIFRYSKHFSIKFDINHKIG